MNMKKLSALILAVLMLLPVLAGCKPSVDTTPTTTVGQGNTPSTTVPGEEESTIWEDDGIDYTYRTYTTVSPSNWNELTYQDANDSTLISYLTSSFFTYDFKFDEYGEIVPGEFVVKFMAATGLEDVTTEYAEAWGLLDAEGNPQTKGYAYKITLREDLMWDNGDPIVAADFVYTMQEQLNPLFQHYRKDSFYAGSVNLVGAKDYVYQGQSGWFASEVPYSTYSEDLDSVLIWKMGQATEDVPAVSYFANWLASEYLDGADTTLEDTAAFLSRNFGMTVDTLLAMEGKTLAEIKADPDMLAAYQALHAWWGNIPDETQHFFVTNYTYPEASWDNVGLLATDTYELVVIMTDPLELLDEEGNLTYHCAYDFSGLPLVHEETWEACKVAPVDGSTLWTTTYNSNQLTTRSWGAFKLDSFQSGKEYTVSRNTNWFGYKLEGTKGLYQTDKIVVETIEEWSTAWMKFLAGEIDGIGIDASIAAEYKGSSRAYFTPDDFIQSAQLQSSREGLEGRESEGVNKTILLYTDFRKAMSLAIDRADYAARCTTSSLAGFGLFNSMHYYDVANGGVYRNTDVAKQVLCDTYAVDVSQYGSLDEAVASITGYNLEEAKKLVQSAYDQAVADGEIDADDKVVLTFGSSADNESVRRHYDYLTTAWTKMCEGTSLEGRIEFEFNSSFGSKWATDFRGGAYDICMGGWSGAAWNPAYLIMAYLNDDYRYAVGWDPRTVALTFTMPGVGENGADVTDTLNLLEWYDCLNGISGCKYNWGEGFLDDELRLTLLAALEGEVLKTYYAVPMLNSYGASLLSYKVDYITYEYNTFMGYGGLKYMTYNFDDAGWEAEVDKVGGELNYKN